MAAEQIEYEMSLNDLVSGKLDNAEKHAQKFEGRLGSVHSSLSRLGEKALQVGETLGISFAYIKFEEFFSKGTEMVHEQDIAIGQLDNTLKNVGERAGLTGDQLVSMAQRLEREIPFTTAQIVEMETALSRFGNMTPGVYQKVLAMSADIATALKRDGTEVATTLGRIMEAPAENGRLLRQLNVTLTVEQRKYLMGLEQTGQVAKAQTFIFQELATKGYGGAAKAAANSDPLFKYNKVMYDLQIEVGKAGIAFEEYLAPALEYVGNALRTGYHYVENFSSYLRDNVHPILTEIKNDAIALSVGIGVAAIGWALANPPVIAYTFSLLANGIATAGLTVATGALTAAQWLLNLALDANPIGALVVVIGAAVTGIILAYHHFTGFRAVLTGIGEVAKDLGLIFMGTGEMILGALSFDPHLIKAGFEDMAHAAADVGSAFHRGYSESMADSEKEDAKEKHETTMGKTVKKAEGKKPVLGTMVGGKSGTTTRATGSRVTTINIKIDKLGCDLTINTTKLEANSNKLKDLIIETLTGAVNDSQLVAGD